MIIAPAFDRTTNLTHKSALPGSSQVALKLQQQVERVGPHFRRILITSEPGSDRERVARVLWCRSPHSAGLFRSCSLGEVEEAAFLARQDTFAERLALKRLIGIAATDERGVLWIDDVSSLSSNAQGLLLRWLRDPLLQSGSVRLAAGTSASLKVRAASGDFLPELRLALEQLVLHIPPLRDRLVDLPELASETIQVIAREYNLPPFQIAPECLEVLSRRAWSGNEQEFDHVLRTALLASGDGVLQPHHLPQPSDTGRGSAEVAPESPERLQEVIDRHVRRTLEACDGNKLRTADRLGISRSTLYRMLDSALTASESTEPLHVH